jgi:hypothetical protein
MTVSAGRIEALLKFPEYLTDASSRVDNAPHKLEYAVDFASGTGTNQHDLVFSQRIALTGTAVTRDLIGSLSRALGQGTLSMVEVVGFGIINRSTTAGQFLTIGNATNPFSAWLGAGTHTLKIGPNGLHIICSPIDGYAAVAGASDEIKFDPGAFTFNVDWLIWGRSA